MNIRNKEVLCRELMRLTNSAFQFTEESATAVATIHPTRHNVFSIDINGQEFWVTVTKVS